MMLYFLRTFQIDLCIWPIAQYINFTFVPPHLRVIYISFVSFIWGTFLAYYKQRFLKDSSDCIDDISASRSNVTAKKSSLGCDKPATVRVLAHSSSESQQFLILSFFLISPSLQTRFCDPRVGSNLTAAIYAHELFDQEIILVTTIFSYPAVILEYLCSRIIMLLSFVATSFLLWFILPAYYFYSIC